MPRDIEKKRAYDKVYRQVNKEKIKERAKKYAGRYYRAHREKVLEAAKAYRKAYRKERLVYGRAYYATHRDELRRKANAKTEQVRLEVLTHYSTENFPKCVNCGNEDTDVLEIDHINNDGAEDRRTIGLGANLYRWLKKHNYPEGYQTLCCNCNRKKQRQAIRNKEEEK